jgi:hypothetical protein
LAAQAAAKDESGGDDSASKHGSGDGAGRVKGQGFGEAAGELLRVTGATHLQAVIADRFPSAARKSPVGVDETTESGQGEVFASEHGYGYGFLGFEFLQKLFSLQKPFGFVELLSLEKLFESGAKFFGIGP